MNKKIGYTKSTDKQVDDIKRALQEEFRKEGFVPMFDLDMKNTANEKLSENFTQYYILGYYNISYAISAIEKNPDAGLLIPTVLVLYEINGIRYLSGTEPTNIDSLSDEMENFITRIDGIIKSVIDKAIE
ncbi:MAG: DUF302 domain-containing protein [Patescibacteria group bacterium]